MEQSITITYNVVERTIRIEPNDFTTFEALGILEAAKAMVVDHWLKDEE